MILKKAFLGLVGMLCILSVGRSFAQENGNQLKLGIYGIYSTPDIYGRPSLFEMRTVNYSVYNKPWQELNLMPDGTFTFYDLFDECRVLEFTGTWKIKQDKLILYDFKNNKEKPMPKKFRIKDGHICYTEESSEICLEWQEKTRR